MWKRYHYKFNDSLSDDSIFIRIKRRPRLYNMQIKFKILKTEVSENYPFRKNSQVIGNKTLGPSRFLILQTPTNPTDPPAPITKPPAAGTKPPAAGTKPTDPPAAGTKPPAPITKPTDPPAAGTKPPAAGTKPPAAGTKPIRLLWNKPLILCGTEPDR